MLEVRDVSFSYRAGTPVLAGVSLCVHPEERVRISAPSGAGKTTLCSLIAGYRKPCAGDVLVDGAPLPDRGLCPVQLIGQHPERMLDPRMRMRETLREAGALDVDLMEALGIESRWLGRFPHELSGGEMQRFCIVRALMAHPRYVVADEISTMLDAFAQAQVWKTILAWCAQHDAGLLFTTHSNALAAHLATRTFELRCEDEMRARPESEAV